MSEKVVLRGMLGEILTWAFIGVVYCLAFGVLALPKHWYRTAQFLFALATLLADVKIIHWAITSLHGPKMRVAWSCAGILATTGAAIWFTRKVQVDISRVDLNQAKRSFLVERLTDFISEARYLERTDRSHQMGMTFTFDGKVEHFLALYSSEYVQRFKERKLLALEEIISDLLREGEVGDAVPTRSLILEIDTGLYMKGFEPLQSNVFLFRDKATFPGEEGFTIDSYELKVFLRVRLDNRGPSTSRSQEVIVTLRAKDDELPLHFTAHEDGQYLENGLADIPVKGGHVTAYYELSCNASFQPEKVERLTTDSYLRVRLNAINQPPFCVDFDIDWAKAKTGERALLTERRKGPCS